MNNFHTIVVGKGDLITLFYKVDGPGREVPHISFTGFTAEDQAGKKEVEELLNAVVLLQKEARQAMGNPLAPQLEPSLMLAFSFGIRRAGKTIIVPALNTNWSRPGTSTLTVIARFESALRYSLKRL